MAAPAHEHGHQLGDHLYIHRHTWIHDLPAQVKIAAGLLLTIVGVNVPPARWPLLLGFLAVVVGLWLAARLPIRKVAPRLLVEVPFLGFALLLPFVAPGDEYQIAGVGLSAEGILLGGTFVLKSTLGVSVAVLLSATSTAQEILTGLSRLRLPAVLVQIAALMVRYSAVVTDELRRMELARSSRCATSGLRSWGSRASGVGALFIRSYERGERVHLAMLSRGGDGSAVLPVGRAGTTAQWLVAIAVPAVALIGLIWSGR